MTEPESIEMSTLGERDALIEKARLFWDCVLQDFLALGHHFYLLEESVVRFDASPEKVAHLDGLLLDLARLAGQLEGVANSWAYSILFRTWPSLADLGEFEEFERLRRETDTPRLPNHNEPGEE